MARKLGFQEAPKYEKPPEPPHRFVAPREEAYRPLKRGGRPKERQFEVIASDGRVISHITAKDIAEAQDLLRRNKSSGWYPKDATVRRSEVREAGGHVVADFDTLDDLITHSGATHLASDKHGVANRLYVPEDRVYLELRVWQKAGFWHAENPDRGKLIRRLPQNAQPILHPPGAAHKAGRVARRAVDFGKRAVDKAKKAWGAHEAQAIGLDSKFEVLSKDNRVIAHITAPNIESAYNDLIGGKRSGFYPRDAWLRDPESGKGYSPLWPSKTREAPRRAGADRARRAEAAGKQYAIDQLNGDYFQNYIREQIIEANKMPPDEIIPLDSERNAKKIARNMLQQLEWDTMHDVAVPYEFAGGGAPGTEKAFRSGIQDALRADTAVEWLSDELLEIQREINGREVEEAPMTTTNEASGRLTTPQRQALQAIAQNGGVLVETNNWGAGNSLIRKGLATKALTDASLTNPIADTSTWGARMRRLPRAQFTLTPEGRTLAGLSANEQHRPKAKRSARPRRR